MRDIFFDSVESYWKSLLDKKFGKKYECKKISVSSTCFLYKISTDRYPTLIAKGNLFGRSMLYAFEQFQKSNQTFVELIEKDFEGHHFIQREYQDLCLLQKVGVTTPKIYSDLQDRVLLMEYLSLSPKGIEESPECWDSLLQELLKMHTALPSKHLPIRSLNRVKEGLMIQDSNFNMPILFRGVADNIASLLLTVSGASLIHGDLKESNMVCRSERSFIFDPKLSIGLFQFDIGKLLWRLLCKVKMENRNGEANVIQFGEYLCQMYQQEFQMSKKQVEGISLILGLMEVYHLLSSNPRKDIDILGSEMVDLYALKSWIDGIYHHVVLEGQRCLLRDLANFF